MDAHGGLSIALHDVSYIYPERDRPALSHLTLSLPPGTCTAVVGRSGSGKTTLINLLLRVMDPTEGVIMANGAPLTTIPLDSWRRQVALVPQRPYHFRGTVRDNIRLACPHAGDEEVLHAATLAGCIPFITELPDGLDTVIGEQGEGLSAGQRQRLAIARAFLKDAPLLLLDEPTSALDPESEAAIRQALSFLMRDRTVLVVAHRLNTVRAASRIAVLDGGRLAEVGRHDDLLRGDGLYTTLMGGQRREALTA
jgi:ABC-type multidrug transport system fused ATPase/permease subunit